MPMAGMFGIYARGSLPAGTYDHRPVYDHHGWLTYSYAALVE
jgi:hypothetical protein